MERVFHLQEANEQVRMKKNIASTSFASIFINEKIITDENTSTKQHPLRCYRPRHLDFNTSVEEEDIMEWIHLEPSVQQRVSTPLPSKKNTKNTENTEKIENTEKTENIKNTENKIESNTEDNNKIIIHKLYIKVQSLKSENVRLRKQIRDLKYRLRHIPQRRKMPKKDKQKKKIFKKLINEQDLHPVAKAMINLQLHIPNAAYTEEKSIKATVLLFSCCFLPLKKSRL